MFYCQFFEISKNNFCYRTPPLAASGNNENTLSNLYLNEERDYSGEIKIQDN